MATIHLCFSPSLSTTLSPPSSNTKTPAATLTSTPFYFSTSLSHSSNPKFNGNRKRGQIVAAGSDLLGDFGARDPFPAEIESRFGEKVLGNVNTEHKILIPNISALSLSQQDCEEVFPSQPPISPQDAQQLIRKVVGWRLVDDKGSLRLQCLWKLRDYKSAVELVNRIYQTVEDTRHYPNLHLEPPNQVRAELWTSSIGGLSMNDFIVAAKIDEIKTSDLVPKKRVWA